MAIECLVPHIDLRHWTRRSLGLVLLVRAQLDDKATQKHQRNADPGCGRTAIPKEESPEQHADQREPADVGANHSSEVEATQIDQNAIRAKHDEPKYDEEKTSAGDASSNQRITTNLEGGGQKHQPELCDV